MARFSGKVGFVFNQTEYPVGSGIYVDHVEEKHCFGETVNKSYRWSQQSGDLDKGSPTMTLTIVADEFITSNWSKIKYIYYNGTPLKVENVTPGHPRITLSIGGVYNGKTKT